MKVIVGLGNVDHPGTRHNVGYDFLDYLRFKYNGSGWVALQDAESDAEQGLLSSVVISNSDVILFKPTLGNINNSGKPLMFFKKNLEIDLKDIIIVHDDLNLSCGQFKIKEKAGAAKHNAIKNIVSYFGKNFARIKIGIGRPEKRESVLDYVLSPPYNNQVHDVEVSMVKASEALEYALKTSLQEAMSKYNGETDGAF